MRRVPLPSPALYPLLMFAAAGVIYGAATLVHGSGFLAVFVAGILLGDRALPHRREVDGFLSSLGSLAEIAMFIALGLTIDLTELSETDAWFEGLVLAVLLAFVIRPLVVGALLLPVRLEWGERLFVMWSGLKGAVPILLAALALIARCRRRAGDLRDRLRRRALLGGRPGDARAGGCRAARRADGARGPQS